MGDFLSLDSTQSGVLETELNAGKFLLNEEELEQGGPFYIPDRHLRAPELLIPRRQPVGPVEVDFSHPMARGLIGAVLPPQGELVTGAPVVAQEYSRIAILPEGQAYYSAYNASGEGAWLATFRGLDGMGRYTIVNGSRSIGTEQSVWAAIWRVATDDADAWPGLTRQNSDFLWTAGGNIHATSTDLFDGDFHITSTVSTGANSAGYLYIDFDAKTGNQNPDNTRGTFNTNTIRIGCTVASATSNCATAFLWVYKDRVFTREEHLAMVHDPYCFLKPRGT